MTVRVDVLGRLAVERDGALVELPRSAARPLAYLACHPGRHPRDGLAARFWPHVTADAARASLRSAIWQVRRSLGDQAVVATRIAVGLDDQVVVDLREFEQMLRDGDAATAVERCGGDVLPDFADDWARDVRAAHHARHAAALDRLAATAGDGRAAHWLRLRCAHDPLDEPAHTALISCLAGSGERAAALVVAREFVERLREELGINPGPALRAALAEVRGAVPQARNDPALRRLPLFGRSAELSRLMEQWAAARSGRGRIVLLTGEAGIGKTRLVTEVALRTAEAGARVAVGAGVDVGGEAPFALWHELVQELVATVPVPPADVDWPAELGRLAPDLAGRLGRRSPAATVASPELERLRLVDAVLRLVEWAAKGRPVLLVAEDIHRADRASLGLCAHIGRRIGALPVLFVLTRRDRPQTVTADALLADVAGRGGAVEEIDLLPLTAGEVAAVTRSVARLGDDDVARVVLAAEGNPLLAVEQARALAAGSPAPPASLRAVARAALRSLPPGGRQVAEAVAVAGRGLTSDEVDALGVAAPDRAAVLDTGLMQRDGDRLAFRHALFAEAVRADLVEPQARHRDVADAVLAAAGPGADRVATEVARHLTAAGRDDLAGPHWQRGARHARSVGALAEAAAFWAAAIRCAPDDPNPRFELAEVHAWRGRRAEFEEMWTAALARTPPGDHAAAWARRGAVMRSVLCHPSDGLAAYRSAFELLPDDAPAPVRAEVLVGLAQLTVMLDPAGAAALLAQAEALLPSPTPDLRVDYEAARLLVLTCVADAADLAAAARRSAQILSETDRPDQAFAGLVTAACGLAARNDLTAALEIAESALRLTRAVPILALPCLAACGHLLARLGRHADALALADEQLELADRLDSADLVALARNDAGLMHLAAGQWAPAAALLQAALDADARINRPASRLAMAEALARSGSPEAARAEIRRAALEPVRDGDQPWALVPSMARVQALIAVATDDLVEARRRFTEALEGWQRRRAADVGTGVMASLLDLGRPPVVGLADPDWELARVRGELHELQEA